MITNYEDQKEYEMMYEYVMRNSDGKAKTKDEIIEYLVERCYYIELHNDQLTDIIKQMKSILGVKDYTVYYNDLPF